VFVLTDTILIFFSFSKSCVERPSPSHASFPK